MGSFSNRNSGGVAPRPVLRSWVGRPVPALTTWPGVQAGLADTAPHLRWLIWTGKR
jgi:hypothetical protein